jgi:hypothetical protein
MSGDYSRIVYDPARDYNGVLLQQGRPLTDWDWNDQVAQANRRAQAASHDTFGGQSVVPLSTPDGFKLALAGAMLTIGRGRIYVDGLLTENHGLPSGPGTTGVAWDTALAEPYGTQPISYDQQPYLPQPPALPEAGGPHQVYLDVWQRELTQFNAPALVDSALGVDTTTRLQTVWQVKLLANDQNVALTCGTRPDQIPGWPALTAPSDGRLSTGTAIYGSDNPCLVSPPGGYTGLENQLYRVEVHEGGAPGQASFKWSRDNASVETRITRFIDARTLVLESVGKDAVLRFNDGDWVEVLDDWLELNNLPGELRRIVVGGGVDDGTRTVTLEKPVSDGRFPVDAQGKPAEARHTRIRRWDQKGTVLRTDTPQPSAYADLNSSTSTGAITIPDTGAIKLALENGIVVSFDVAAPGGVFRSGDWWVFTARAGEASIEQLDHAAPRGIHHHYAKLGLYTPGLQPTDCRQFWPPSLGETCECTVCVSPQAHANAAPSLQQAIDIVIARGGGTVCMDVGDYALEAPLRIEGAATLTLRGQGDRTRLLADAAVVVDQSADVTLEEFSVVYASPAGGGTLAPNATPVIFAVDSQDLRLRSLTIKPMPDHLADGVAIGLASELTRVQLKNNQIQARFGVRSCSREGDHAAEASVAVNELLLDGNVFVCSEDGVALTIITGDGGPTVRILDNRINCGQTGIRLVGISDVSEGMDNITNGDAEISSNRIECGEHGIFSDFFGLRASDNDIRCSAPLQALVSGIILPSRPGSSAPPNGRCHLIGNYITGFGDAGISVKAGLAKLQIKQNQIEHCARSGVEVEGPALGGTVINGDSDGPGIIFYYGINLVSIENNQISSIGPESGWIFSSFYASTAGIRVALARDVSILTNTIDLTRDLLSPPAAPDDGDTIVLTRGIVVVRCEGTRVGSNQITIPEPPSFSNPPYFTYGTLDGILIGQSVWNVLVYDNRVHQDYSGNLNNYIGIRVDQFLAEPTLPPLPTPSPTPTPSITIRHDDPEPPPTPAMHVSVRGNQIISTAVVVGEQVSMVRINSGGDCDFSNNQCRIDAVDNGPLAPDVRIFGKVLSVIGNRIHGRGFVELFSNANASSEYTLALVGNITREPILFNGQTLFDSGSVGLQHWIPLNPASNQV